ELFAPNPTGGLSCSALLAYQPQGLAKGRPAAGYVAAFELHRDGASAAGCSGGDGTASPVAGALKHRLIGHHMSFPCFP
ncbi:MAG: hypothetical protein ACXWU4_08815, partial [Allosphingosinicella sp.]